MIAFKYCKPTVCRSSTLAGIILALDSSAPTLCMSRTYNERQSKSKFYG